MAHEELHLAMTCGKVRYSNELDAKIALATLLRKDNGEKRYYRCPNCKGWHITSQDKQSNRFERRLAARKNRPL